MSLWLACRSLGMALMPVDAGTPTAEIAALARRFGATIAILPASTPGIEALGAATPFDRPLVAVKVANATPAPQIYRGAAALKVTSGSTGLPKATFTRESQLVADTAQSRPPWAFGPEDCQIAAIPISHAYGLGNLVMPLLLQGTPIVLREAFIPQQLHADATKYGRACFQACRSCLLTSPTTRTPSPGRASSRRSSVPARRSIPSWRTHSLERSASRFTPSTAQPKAEGSPSTTRRRSRGRHRRPAVAGVTITLRPEEGAPIDGGRVHVAGDAVVRLRRAGADR